MANEQYTVYRLGVSPVTEETRQSSGLPDTVHEYVGKVAEFGPFDAATARRRAIDIAELSGDDVDVVRVGELQAIASIRDGERFIAEQHDDDGNRLPREQWNDFWNDKR